MSRFSDRVRLWKVEGRRATSDGAITTRGTAFGRDEATARESWLQMDAQARTRALYPEHLPAPWRPEELTLTPLN